MASSWTTAAATRKVFLSVRASLVGYGVGRSLWFREAGASAVTSHVFLRVVRVGTWPVSPFASYRKLRSCRRRTLQSGLSRGSSVESGGIFDNCDTAIGTLTYAVFRHDNQALNSLPIVEDIIPEEKDLDENKGPWVSPCLS